MVNRDEFVPTTCGSNCASGRCNGIHGDPDAIRRHSSTNSRSSSQLQSNQLFGDNSSRRKLVVGTRNEKNTTTFSEFIKSRLFVSILVLCAVFMTLLCVGLVVMYEKDNDVTQSVDAWNDKLTSEQLFWFNDGLDELKNAISLSLNTRRAKNVILFVADGMGPASVTASRIYKSKEEGHLMWEKFPHMGMLKTYCMDKQVPDSMSTATALFGGVKANYETGGLDASAKLGDCQSSLNTSHHVESILHWAQNEGMGTGFVTTTRVVHATPAALYANCPDRRWECEANMPAEALGKCKDIARQLVEEGPGNKLNVIMGGGRQCLVSNVTSSEADPVDTWSCYRNDGRNLIKTWEDDKRRSGKPYAVLSNNNDLENLNEKAEYVMGIFANGHLKYESERDRGPNGMPSLSEMTTAAINVLEKQRRGFVLVVEGGMIDQAHHRGMAKQALNEVLALDKAVEETVKLMAGSMDETLIIVTSDHAHTLQISGYPERGNSIFGIAQKSKMDQIPYTTLGYMTGGPDGYQVEISPETGEAKRKDPSKENTEEFTYIQQTGILTDENTHSGVDVAIHAIGPWAHLFHRTHEQSYVAHVISFAARIGRFRDTQSSLFSWLGV